MTIKWIKFPQRDSRHNHIKMLIKWIHQWTEGKSWNISRNAFFSHNLNACLETCKNKHEGDSRMFQKQLAKWQLLYYYISINQIFVKQVDGQYANIYNGIL